MSRLTSLGDRLTRAKPPTSYSSAATDIFLLVVPSIDLLLLARLHLICTASMDWAGNVVSVKSAIKKPFTNMQDQEHAGVDAHRMCLK